ncbi:MAG: uracil phosphoribosyltransferase [Bacteroidales bacterium]|nr:uracil phosphoribosyltransferase [Bacteroidales bacterium]
MVVKNLTNDNSLFSHFLAEIRDEETQKDSMRFRRNLERVGEMFAYEISKVLKYTQTDIQTPLGIARENVLKDKILLATILRAGLPMHQGLLNYFDKAENAFISAFRKYDKDGSFDIKLEYISSPSPENKIVIISDPMLATGASMVYACRALIQKGIPKHIHIVTAIASKEGVEFVNKNLGGVNFNIWAGAIDEELTVKSYIVPGLGDAGDLAYGGKE